MKPLPPFQVIYQTAEDGLGDTVKPRLMEAEADLDRVLVIDEAKRELTLSDERIEKAITQNGARLIILDPIQAYMGEKTKGTEYLFTPPRVVVGKCPRCGGDVAELQKGFFCQNEGCKFAIWKNNKWWELKRKQPTKAVVTALLKDGRAHVTGLYSEKTGKTYDATVVLEDDGKYANFKLAFDRQKGGKR